MIFAMSCWLAGVMFAQDAPAPANGAARAAATEAEKPKPGVIEGRVLNGKSGEPLRRATVTLRNNQSPGPFVNAGPARVDSPYVVSTDAEGKFRLDGVEPGTYRLSADRQGFIRSEYGAQASSLSGLGTAVRVSPGSELKNLDVKLTPHAVVAGRVFDEEGEPLANVRVTALQRRYMQGKKQMVPVGGAQTNDIGEFRVAGLRPGSYWISAESFHPNRMWSDGPPRNAGDKPEDEYVQTFFGGVTDAAAARPVEVVAGQELAGVDIRMGKARVYRVRGKVIGPASALRNMRVMLAPRERNARMFFYGGMGSPVKPDGSFEIGGVQPGGYHLVTMGTGPQSAAGRVAVDVTRENVDRVTLALAPGVNLSGVVRVEGEGEARTPMTGVRVQLSAMDAMGFSSPSAAAKDDGSFTVENVGTEKYRVNVYGLPPGLWLKSVRAGEQEVLESGLDCTASAPGALQIVLGAGTGTVTGLVQDEQQKPVPGAVVTLRPEPFQEERYDLTRTTTTDQNGQFKLEGLAPGEYKVYAWAEIEPGAANDLEFLKPFESKGQKLSVKANGQHPVTLTQIVVEEDAR